tara:strand:- start:7704 stop:7964 length:261 start_codon:yes stop_codon:yes gene_type:complete
VISVPGAIEKTWTSRPKPKRAKLVWVGAFHAIGRPPFSILMKPSFMVNGMRTTRWVIKATEDDPEPIVIDAPAKEAYRQLVRKTSL